MLGGRKADTIFTKIVDVVERTMETVTQDEVNVRTERKWLEAQKAFTSELKNSKI